MESEIRVEVLKALANIIDNFHNFNSAVIELFNSEYPKNLTAPLDLGCDISEYIEGKRIVGHKKLKEFCELYKTTIEEISKYTWIGDFMYSYDFNRKTKKLELNDNLEYFYQYLYANKKDIDKINVLLDKIDSLNISRLILDPNLDLDILDGNVFSIETIFNDNYNFTYFDNIEIIPNYEKGIVKYKSKKSNYALQINSGVWDKKVLVVDSLTFDPNVLPLTSDKNELSTLILEMQNKNLDACENVRNAVDLSVGVDDLVEQYNKIKKVVNNITDYSDREKVYKSLVNLNECIKLLSKTSENYNQRVAESNPKITEKTLEKEKKQYLKRRYWSNFDLD